MGGWLRCHLVFVPLGINQCLYKRAQLTVCSPFASLAGNPLKAFKKVDVIAGSLPSQACPFCDFGNREGPFGFIQICNYSQGSTRDFTLYGAHFPSLSRFLF